jgi:hypothetical protein
MRRLDRWRARQQRGATLLVTLVLLGALLALAVSGTQSAAEELAMAGNERWRLQAMAAAERGLALAEAALVAAPIDGTPAPVTGGHDAASPGDTYDYRLRDLGADARLLETSGGARRGRLYVIAATGHSRRGATVSVESGVRVVRTAGGALLALERDYWIREDVE